jgi:hypothetical protein
VDSADKTNISRYLSDAPWREERLNDTRVSYMQSQTAEFRARDLIFAQIEGDSILRRKQKAFLIDIWAKTEAI